MSQRRIRLALLDDRVLFRESLARLLSSDADFYVIAECGTQSEALKSLKGSGVYVVLVGIANSQGFYRLCAQGASGVFRDADPSAWLVQAIRLVANGEGWVDHKVIQLLAEGYQAS